MLPYALQQLVIHREVLFPHLVRGQREHIRHHGDPREERFPSVWCVCGAIPCCEWLSSGPVEWRGAGHLHPGILPFGKHACRRRSTRAWIVTLVCQLLPKATEGAPIMTPRHE